MTDAAALLSAARVVLLDFDGPVTSLLPAPVNKQVADAGRAALAGSGVVPPSGIAGTSDHLAVLRWVGVHAPEALPDVEAALVAAEVLAAARCLPTPGAHELLAAVHASGVPVVVVSNNAAGAVRTYLERWGIAEVVRDVVGRPSGRPDLMKPNPHMVEAALRAVGGSAGEAVLIGDSVTDVEVARAAVVSSIGYAKTPRRGRELHDAGADAVTDSMATLVRGG